MSLFIPLYGRIWRKVITVLSIIFGVLAACGGAFSAYCMADAIIKKEMRYFLFSLFLFFVFIVVPLFFYFIGKKVGLYIENDRIYYRAYRKKYYNVEDFAGLLILKAQFKSRYSSPEYIKNKQGKYEYSIVYLNDTRHEFETYKSGVLDFTTYWARYVHFYTTYDERVIEYFKAKNVPIICNQENLQCKNSITLQ